MSRLFSFLATRSPQPRQGRLLRKLLDGAQAIAAREVESFRFRLADALLKLSETTQVPAEEQASFHGHNHLRKEGDKLCAAFNAALNQHTSAALRALEEGRQDLPPLIPANLDGAEDRLLLDELANALERQCADALAMLNCSLAVLLERETLATQQNPWRPQVFLTAFHHAWCTIDKARASRRVVLGLLGPQMFLRLDALYAGLNAALAEAGIAPDARALARARRSVAPVATVATDQADAPPLFAATTSPVMRMEDERYYRVRDWLLAGSTPPPAGNEGEVADLNLPDLFAAPNTTGDLQANTINVAVAPRLFTHLTRLQQKLERTLRQSSAEGTEILRHISRGLPPGVLSRVDENTLELVERVFEQLLQSPTISDSLKPLLVRLQVPVLKAALMDRKFFIDGANPAHRLLDLVVNCGLDFSEDLNSGSGGNPGASESLGLALQRAVDRIAAEFDQDLAMCAEVAADLENLLQNEAQQVETAIAECITQGLRAEKLYLAEQAARADLLERLDAGVVPYALENFLQTQWLRVLTLAHAARNKKPEILERALAVMDDLLWSLQAKADSAERKVLLQRLPDILLRLNTWLDAIKWSGPERDAFFAALAQQHANLVRSPRADSHGKLEAALTQTRRAAERSMFGARRKPLPGAIHPASPLDSLCHGDWLELQNEDGSQRALRLAWVSPQRSQFVLASRHAVSTCLYSERELEHRLQQGQVRMLQVEGAVGRALDAVLAEGRPAHAA